MTGKVQTRKYSSYENDTTGNSQNCYNTTEKKQNKNGTDLSTNYDLQNAR